MRLLLLFYTLALPWPMKNPSFPTYYYDVATLSLWTYPLVLFLFSFINFVIILMIILILVTVIIVDRVFLTPLFYKDPPHLPPLYWLSILNQNLSYPTLNFFPSFLGWFHDFGKCNYEPRLTDHWCISTRSTLPCGLCIMMSSSLKV